jgi:hypothetical protein
MPLYCGSPLHWPPTLCPCSNTTGTKPSLFKYLAAASPAGPAPITATVCMSDPFTAGENAGRSNWISL